MSPLSGRVDERPSEPQGSPDDFMFIHGGLRRGLGESDRLRSAEYLNQVQTRGQLHQIDGSPVFVPGAEGAFVFGDLRRFDRHLLDEALDWDRCLGRLPDQHFVLSEIDVQADNLGLRSWKAWAWQWTGPLDPATRIPCGDWAEWYAPRPAPWYTSIAGICLLFPLFAIVWIARAIAGPGYGWEAILLMALLSPLAGLFAARLATRRRERWESLRTIIICCLWIASVPALIGLSAFLLGALRSFV